MAKKKNQRGGSTPNNKGFDPDMQAPLYQHLGYSESPDPVKSDYSGNADPFSSRGRDTMKGMQSAQRLYGNANDAFATRSQISNRQAYSSYMNQSYGDYRESIKNIRSKGLPKDPFSKS